ncbi:tRNA (cytidine(34)-2'-O)-methyltransferase [Aquibaculum arenosum]|uniref:tRNA (cytidine(34)-2'-O)-methyltransferase n=1 Tax=Aquibaculum arenosum TaxID=3032591 RepID=A0ABT5YMB8_9PROT|nr:tRNA (cytidine(34)-2'-O)-methyltransferase [Fodinicurvata sp. CAU 1616]MDF2095905.1 tRNA (cytidine(34)-2'-O)-methyltransferase [Fodinicurvata sp. CAU 1616]
MRLALYQPDIPQNCGTLLRLAACLAVPVDLIEPFGFLWDDKRLRRAGLDYAVLASVTRHSSWDAFLNARAQRLVLLTTAGTTSYTDFAYRADDILLLGRESAGAPESVHAAADARLVIPLSPGFRSLNVAVAGAMVLGEALRQTAGFPQQEPQ